MFKFYITTTLISIFIIIVYGLAIKQELKREGFEIGKVETTVVEEIQKWIPCFVPILNLIFAAICIFGKDMVKEKMKMSLSSRN